MNAKAALCLALLKGDVVTIKTGFTNFGITNIPREISRAIEQPFNVEVSRTRKDGVSRYNVPCYWYEYRLNSSEHNLDGMKAMKEYVVSQAPPSRPPKTDREAKELRQTNLFMNL